MPTVMSGSASECLCAMSFVAAVPELITIQANQFSPITRVMMHHGRVITVSTFDHLTSLTSQHLFEQIALPTKTTSCGKSPVTCYIFLTFGASFTTAFASSHFIIVLLVLSIQCCKCSWMLRLFTHRTEQWCMAWSTLKAEGGAVIRFVLVTLCRPKAFVTDATLQ